MNTQIDNSYIDYVTDLFTDYVNLQIVNPYPYQL